MLATAGRSGKRPTIVDVARAAGVSPTTVSHSLNGRGYVDPRTRERVVAAAQELGYRPSLRAQRLRAGSARTIGLVSSMPVAVAGGASRLGFFMEVAAAAAEAALTHGFAMVLVPPLESTPSLAQFDIDGAIVVEPEQDDVATAQLRELGIPVVSIGRQPGAEAEVPYVDAQASLTGRLLLDHLHDQGSRSIALLTGAGRRHSYVEMSAVYDGFVAERGLDAVVARVDEHAGEDGGYAAMRTLLRDHPGLDGLCAPVDAFAVGAVRALAEEGRRVPDDVRVVTRYSGVRARTCRPPLTAVDMHLDELSALAVGLLLERLRGDSSRPAVAGPPPVLIPRESSMLPTPTG
ncbi:LacI family DNA-binding transcriptional regulator [Pseudonocardia nigra]|uniref:LacI family DNA-binding transcriptional regulator n=1 Tax=Pseudonocardia nigra TaxID=1921578 RepID=UPI001C603D9E|nr:LacI family DNA-binding transcriptional regulator [Pseudonocardia nigra]